MRKISALLLFAAALAVPGCNCDPAPHCNSQADCQTPASCEDHFCIVPDSTGGGSASGGGTGGGSIGGGSGGGTAMGGGSGGGGSTGGGSGGGGGSTGGGSGGGAAGGGTAMDGGSGGGAMDGGSGGGAMGGGSGGGAMGGGSGGGACAGAATYSVIATGTTNVNVDTCGAFQVVLGPSGVAGGEVVTLNSNLAGITFFNGTDSTCSGAPITTLTFPASCGSSSQPFHARPSRVGRYSLSVIANEPSTSLTVNVPAVVVPVGLPDQLNTNVCSPAFHLALFKDYASTAELLPNADFVVSVQAAPSTLAIYSSLSCSNTTLTQTTVLATTGLSSDIYLTDGLMETSTLSFGLGMLSPFPYQAVTYPVNVSPGAANCSSTNGYCDNQAPGNCCNGCNITGLNNAGFCK